MAIASGVIFPSLGTHAGVPTGFTRETNLDDRYPLGSPAATNPNVTGGASTHTHATSHTHTVGSHTHAGITSGAGDAGSVTNGATSPTAIAAASHTHAFPTTGSQTATLQDSGSVVTASGSSLPSSYGVIWIKSDGSPAGIPNGREALWAGASPPSGWTGQAGPAGKYLVGSAAAADAGASSGSATHLHGGASHSHTISSHAHTIGNTNGPSATDSRNTGANAHASSTHTHTSTISSTANGSSGSQTSGNSGSTDVAPAYYKLGVIRNGTGGDSLPGDIIGAWLGTLASIPSGWALCDGTNGTPDLRDRMILAAAADLSDVGGTGGATSHDHTDPASHTHTTGHTHTIQTSGGPSATTNMGGTNARGSTSGHTHTGGNSGSGGPTSGAGTEAIANASAYPPYRTVAWIQLKAFAQTATPDPVTVPIALPAPTLSATFRVTPDPATVPIATPAPTVALSYSATPAPVTVPIEATTPTLVMGEKVVTPDPVEVPIATPVPTLDNATSGVTPDPVTVPIVTVDPALVIGVKVVTPDPVEVPIATPAPALAAQYTAAPDPVTVPIATPAPVLVMGEKVVTPDPVTVPIATPAPVLVMGEKVVTPDPVAVAISPTSPTVALIYTATPSPVTVPIATPAPVLVMGEKVVTPDPVTVPIALPAPTVRLLYTVTPGPVVVEITLPEPMLGSFLALAPITLAPATAEQVHAALSGQYGAVSLRFRYSRRTRTNEYIDDINGVIEPGTITLDNRRAVVRDLVLQLDRSLLPADFDERSDIIGVVVEVYVPQAEQWVPLQQGLYVLDVTETDNEGALAGRELIPAKGADLMMLLVRAKRTAPTTVPAGANPVAQATAIFTRHGIATNIPTSSAVLPVAVTWGPGATDYQIARDLLRGAHYRAPFIDRFGVATSYPLTALASRAPAVAYKNTAEPKMISARDKYRRHTDRKGLNRIVVVIDHPQHPDRGYVQRENADANAPNSTAALVYGSAVDIVDSSPDSPALITTAAAHGLATGVQVLISGHLGSTPDLNGSHEITVISPTTFTVPITVTAGGSGGTVQATTVQFDARSGDSDPPTKAIVDAASAEGWAEYELQWAAAESEPIDLATFLDPRRDADELYELDIDGIEDEQLAAVIGWRLRLEPGAIMEHNLGRVRDLDLIAPAKP